MPPSLTKDEGLPKLERLIPSLWKKYSYALEVRHRSWFTNEVYDYLSKHGICLVWSQTDAIQTPPEITTDFFYLRLIGDRSIDEKDFGKVQKDRHSELVKWVNVVKKAKDHVGFGIVMANNHYAGFGPGTANSFRVLSGMSEAIWEEKRQTTLS